MLMSPAVNSFNEIVNVGISYTSTPGVSITPGTSSSNGSWTAWATPTNDVYGVWLCVNGGAVSGVAKNHTIDIGIDPSGGSSYSVLMQNLICGYSYNYSTAPVVNPGYGRFYYFPLYIKGGTSIAIRARGSDSTAGSLNVFGKLACLPSNPESIWAGSYCETIGYTSGTLGTSWTTGSLTKGSWTSLGTTSRNLKYLQLSFQTNNSNYSTSSNVFFCEVGYGDATSPTIVLFDVHGGPIFNSEVAIQKLHPTPACFCDIPAGSTLYIRSACRPVFSPNTIETGCNAVVVGIGG